MYIETAADLVRKYGETFVLYDGKIIYVTDFKDIDLKNRQMYFFSADGLKSSTITEVAFDPDKLTNITLEARFVNYQLGDPFRAWKFTRRSRRQNRRGLCDDVASFHNPLAKLLSAAGIYADEKVSFSFSIVEACLNSAYPTYYEALEMLEKQASIAISTNFALCRSPVTKGHAMLSVFGFVGEIHPNYIEVGHVGALQEVRDFVQRSGLTIEVLDASKSPT